MKITSIKGFADILPGEVDLWQLVEARARQILRAYNFAEIRIPILEKTELFSRSIGATTDIVEKEMYSFDDRDSRSTETSSPTKLTLRPEGTAGVVRAYVEAELYKIEPVRKLYYMGPMFRRERPQKGRMRQFHQIGAEALGRGDPFIDAEILLLLNDFLAAVGMTEPSLQINSLGDSECRPKYRQVLLEFLRERRDSLCANCQRRIESNPLRALDCKEPGCIAATKDAPSILDCLCADCRAHLTLCKVCCAIPRCRSPSIHAWCAVSIIIAERLLNGRPSCSVRKARWRQVVATMAWWSSLAVRRFRASALL